MKYKDLKTLSREYRISVFTFRKFVKSGLPHYRLGRKILVDPKEFEAWFEQFKVISAQNFNDIDSIIDDTIAEFEAGST